MPGHTLLGAAANATLTAIAANDEAMERTCYGAAAKFMAELKARGLEREGC
jgi:hypothetical protein